MRLSMSYYDADDYCKRLKIGKHKNFRIPTMNELQSIIDYKTHDPAIIKGFTNTDTESYWTSTPYVGYKDSAWLINFKDGERTYKGKSYTRYVRCVADHKR